MPVTSPSFLLPRNQCPHASRYLDLSVSNCCLFPPLSSFTVWLGRMKKTTVDMINSLQGAGSTIYSVEVSPLCQSCFNFVSINYIPGVFGIPIWNTWNTIWNCIPDESLRFSNKVKLYIAFIAEPSFNCQVL